MKKIYSLILNKEKFKQNILKIIVKIFNFPDSIEIQNKIDEILDILKDNVYFYIEFPYVDKVYRDSYYFYFSSKHKDYLRDCIRVSIFFTKISKDYFRSSKFLNKLQESYCGYFVIRPTLPNIIGRSIISPKVLKNNNFICCLSEYESMVNGIKLKVEGFPHSSQDGETLSCAETTIWCIMEYYGSKYNEYRTILPSEIINKLNNLSYQRLVPSEGLTLEQISYSLKEFGFSTKIYTLNSFQNNLNEFKKLVFYYIESGIPIIASLENNSIGHAIILYGHENFDLNKIDVIKPDFDSIYNTALIDKKIVCMDDNKTPYRLIDYNNPTKNYGSEIFENCKITGIVVPLYNKIHIDALIAEKIIYNILRDNKIGPDDKQIVLRLFLTSSRSFKYKIALNDTLNSEIKDLIISISMPKFIWVAELSNLAIFKDKKANGLIIIDATAGKYSDIYNSILFIIYNDKLILFDNNSPKMYNIVINNFNIFENNLKGK